MIILQQPLLAVDILGANGRRFLAPETQVYTCGRARENDSMKRLNDDIGDMCGRAFSGYHSDTVLTV